LCGGFVLNFSSVFGDTADQELNFQNLGFSIAFNRTLRVPDDNTEHSLPAGTNH
jgi:hypothetical protein